MQSIAREIQMRNSPAGELQESDFTMVEVPVRMPAEGQMLVRVRMLSIDPASRLFLKRETLIHPKIGEGDVMGGFGIGEVVSSKVPGFVPGDLVFAETGWREYALIGSVRAVKLPKTGPLSDYINVFGVTAGFTAFIGMRRLGAVRKGQTVVVSGAAGATGSLAGQIARLLGARVIGVAGGSRKCDVLVKEFGFHDAIDYKLGDLATRVRKAVPEGIDVFLDNVGGEVQVACLDAMKNASRIIISGAISQYDGSVQQNFTLSPWTRINILMCRFIAWDFFDEYDSALTTMKQWRDSGQLVVREEIFHGLEKAPAALVGLFAGDNIGKRMVSLEQ